MSRQTKSLRLQLMSIKFPIQILNLGPRYTLTPTKTWELKEFKLNLDNESNFEHQTSTSMIPTKNFDQYKIIITLLSTPRSGEMIHMIYS